jgi:hypothetical protein
MPPSESGTIPPWVYDYVTTKSFVDAVRKVVWDPKWHAENVPVTGAKAEVAGGKAEANAVALNLFGGQFEYGLFKHELSVNQLLEDRARDKRDREVDGRLTRLTADTASNGKLIEKVKKDLDSTAASLRRTLSEGDKRLRGEVPQLQTKVNNIQTRLLADDQKLHARISALQTKVGQVSVIANNADDRSKVGKTKVKELDKEVREGLRRVEALQGGAQRAGRDIDILINRVTALERALRQ